MTETKARRHLDSATVTASVHALYSLVPNSRGN